VAADPRLTIAEELVDEPLVRGLVEALADHARRHLDGDLADLPTEVLEHPVPLRSDLLLRTGHDGLGLLLRPGLEVAAELYAAGFEVEGGADLTAAIADMTEMCAQARWRTEDPLGIGGLLDDVSALGRAR